MFKRSIFTTMILSILLLSGLSSTKASNNSFADPTLKFIHEINQDGIDGPKNLNRYKTRNDDTPNMLRLGDVTSFWVRGFDGKPDITRASSLRWIGIHSYLYIDDRFSINATKMRDIIDEFDRVIYPKMHEFFGMEPSPGIDGDPRITLLLTDLGDDIAGYFDPRNEYSGEKSNQREMLILNINRLSEADSGDTNGLLDLKATIAHEFQHLIQYANDPDEEIWINEGLSQYAEYLLYGNLSRLTFFYENPSVSLVDWSWGLDSYGASLSFILYFAEHFSKNGNLGALVADTQNGIAGINSYLAKEGYYQRFQEVFNDWAIANCLNNTIAFDGKYGYQSFDDKINISDTNISNNQGTLTFVPWSVQYTKIFPQNEAAVLRLVALTDSPSVSAPRYITFIDPVQPDLVEVVEPIRYRNGECYAIIPNYNKNLVVLYSGSETEGSWQYNIIPEKAAPHDLMRRNARVTNRKVDITKYGALLMTIFGAIVTVVSERGHTA